jgi:hypothetical protein
MGGGGGIYWLYNQGVEICHLTESCKNTYYNNFAPYGNDYATEEVYLEYSPDGLSSYDWNTSSVIYLSSSTTSVIFFIMDAYRQQVITTSNITVDWDTLKEGTSCSGAIDACGTATVTVKDGVATFEDFTSSCSVGETIELSFSTSIMVHSTEVIIEYGICERGQMYYNSSRICVTCGKGTYSLEEFTTDNLNDITSCKTCPSNAECEEDIVTANPGYWKVTYYDDAIMKCPYGVAACMGGVEGGNATCNPG